MLALRDDAEAAQARLQLGILQALRIAIPASLDTKASKEYEDHERSLINQANGTRTSSAPRWSRSKTKTKTPKPTK